MRIVIIQGNPDHRTWHYGHALAEAYADGAREAGHEGTIIEVAALTFPLLRNFNALPTVSKVWSAISSNLPELIRCARASSGRSRAAPPISSAGC